MQAGIHGCLVAGLAGRSDAQGVEQELHAAAGGLLRVSLFQGIRQFQQRIQAAGTGHDQVPQMRGQRTHEMQGVEALGKDFVQNQESMGIVALQEVVYQGEAVLIVQDIEVTDYVFILDIGSAESHGLVEDGEGVAHGAVGLGSDDMKGLVVYLHALLGGDPAQVPHHVRNGNPVEVIGLAPAEDGGENLVLLRGGQDENRVCRGLFQGFEKSVEGGLREHVHLVDDVHAVPAHLRRHLHLLHERLDVLYRIVGSGVQLVDAIGTALLEAHAGLTFPAGLHLRPGMGTVDHLGKDAGGSGFTHAPGAAEQVGMRQLPPLDGIGEGTCNVVLADQALEGVRPVFPGRYDIVAHRLQR